MTTRTARPPAAASPAGLILVLAAATGFGLLPLLSRIAYAAGLSPEAALACRFALPILMFAPALPRLAGWRQRGIALATGLFLGIAILGYFRSLAEMSVAVASLIFFTYPLFAVLVGLVLFRLVPDRRGLAGAALVLAAAALILDPSAAGLRPLTLVHAFLAPAGYATLILVVGHALGSADRFGTIAWIYLGTASAALVIVAGAEPATLMPGNAVAGLAALGLLTVGGVLPQLALVFGAPRLGPGRTAIVAAFELVVALASGWLILGEPMRGVELAGAALIVLAIILSAPAPAPGRDRP